MVIYDLPRNYSKKDAKNILKFMNEIIDEYGFVSVSDFYDFIGSPEGTYLDNKKGWRSLFGSKISMLKRRGRYRIIFPDFDKGVHYKLKHYEISSL